MLSTDRVSKGAWLAAGALMAVFFTQSLCSSLVKSPTWDEPGDLAAGLSYWQTGSIGANPQHPPLLKLLPGLSLWLAGFRLPNNRVVHDMETGVPGAEIVGGSEFVFNTGPDRVMFWARLPFILLASALGLLLFWWGCQLLDTASALAALFLYAFSPTILAHSYLATTDVGLAAFVTLFFFSLWSYLRYPSWRRMLLCGGALGAMLACKFSALILPPVGALLLLAALRWPPARLAGSPVPLWERRTARFPAAGKNDPCPCGSGKKYKVCHGAKAEQANAGSTLPRQILYCALVFLIMCAAALVVVQACYFFPGDFQTFSSGLSRVNADHDPNHLAYLAGHLDRHFLSYFAVAYLLKEPLAGIILAAIGLVALWRSTKVGMPSKLFLLLPPAVLFVGYTLAADDFGIRYMIPALPFVYLIAGCGLAGLVRAANRWGRVAAAVLCLWVVVEAAGIYPDHLSYFNELACLPSHAADIGLDGGSRCGTQWLDDQNVDWGQGVKQLRTWLSAHAAGRQVKLAYWGYFPAEAYGLNAQKIEYQQLLNMKSPEPGLYAVSANYVARAPAEGERFYSGGGAWLQSLRPTAIVGHGFYIFDIPAR